jgi:hypothetical protein
MGNCVARKGKMEGENIMMPEIRGNLFGPDIRVTKIEG